MRNIPPNTSTTLKSARLQAKLGQTNTPNHESNMSQVSNSSAKNNKSPYGSNLTSDNNDSAMRKRDLKDANRKSSYYVKNQFKQNQSPPPAFNQD